MSNVLPEEERINYIQHIEKLQEELAFLKKIYKHVFPENTQAYYICAEQGEKDQLGLPEFVIICPAFGKQELIKFKKVE